MHHSILMQYDEKTGILEIQLVCVIISLNVYLELAQHPKNAGGQIYWHPMSERKINPHKYVWYYYQVFQILLLTMAVGGGMWHIHKTQKALHILTLTHMAHQ